MFSLLVDSVPICLGDVGSLFHYNGQLFTLLEDEEKDKKLHARPIAFTNEQGHFIGNKDLQDVTLFDPWTVVNFLLLKRE